MSQKFPSSTEEDFVLLINDLHDEAAVCSDPYNPRLGMQKTATATMTGRSFDPMRASEQISDVVFCIADSTIPTIGSQPSLAGDSQEFDFLGGAQPVPPPVRTCAAQVTFPKPKFLKFEFMQPLMVSLDLRKYRRCYYLRIST